MKKIVVALAVVLISGCSIAPIDPKLGDNVSLSKSQPYYMEKIMFDFPVKSGLGLEKCVALNVESFTQSSSPISFTSNDKTEIVAVGQKTANFKSGLVTMTKTIRYQLVEKLDKGILKTEFKNIKTAIAAGYVSQTGFATQGAWEGAQAPLVQNTLKGIANAIAECLE